VTWIASAVAGVLAILSGVHVYWALGGRRSIEAAVPEVNGRPTFAPTPLATLGVALALALGATIVLVRAGLWTTVPLSAHMAVWGTWTLALIFLARAVGDFRLVGFTKRVRGTAFARWDTRLYSPLCAGLGAALVWIALD
jgi:hypothetical protein